MLIMRMYALYEQSRKVLALYIFVVVAVVIGGCVSLNFTEFTENEHLASYSISDLVIYSGWCWVEIKKAPWTCGYKLAALQI